MADKLEHSLATAGLALGVGVGALLSGGDTAPTIQLVAGVLTGLVIHPDLDLAENLKGGITKLVWGFYGKLIRHRSPISHAPVVGTVIRLVYLSVIVIPVLVILDVDIMGFATAQYMAIINWFIGLSLADSLHTAIDFSQVYRIGKHRRRTKRGAQHGKRPRIQNGKQQFWLEVRTDPMDLFEYREMG